MKKTVNLFINLIIFFNILSITNAADYGFTYRYFEMADEQATLLGGKVHKTFSSGLGLGAGIYFSETLDILNDNLIEYDELGLSYMGVSVFKPTALFSNLILVPSLFYGQGIVNANRRFVGSDDITLEDSSRFNVVEPGIALTANLTDLIKFETSFSYTYIYQTDLVNYSDNDFGGFTIGFSIVINSNPADDAYISDSITSPAWGRMPGSGN